jgi:hypothetical protein
MNAAENIVQCYFQYVKGIYTRANVRGVGQAELDLIGVDTSGSTPVYYHIESTVSISAVHSRITADKYNPEDARQRSKQARQRRTAGFILARKFYSEEIVQTYRKLGIDPAHLMRVLVSWDFQDEARQELENKGVQCLSMKTLLQELADRLAEETSDLDSDILRTLQLFVRAEPTMPRIYSVQTIRKKKKLAEDG